MQVASFPAVARILALLAVFCASTNVSAQDKATSFYFGTQLSTAYDSNVTQQPPGPGAQGSAIDGASLLAGFDRVYDRQHLIISADIDRYIYRQVTLYDYTKEDLMIDLRSSLPSNIDADIKVERTQQLAQQADLNTIRRDVIAQDMFSSAVRFPFATDWRAVVAFDANTLRNSDAIDRAANLNSTEIDAGIRYQTGAQNYVDLLARTGQSTYPDGALSIFAGLNYHDRGVDLRTKWRFSGVSTLEGRLGYMEQRYDESSFLNFAGPAWDLTYTWLPGSKTSLALYTARVTGPAGNNYFSAAVMHTYRLTPTYQLTSNIHLDAHYEWSSVNYFSNLQALAEGLPPATVRSDIDTNYGFGASWTPRRWLIIKLIAVRQQRNSVSTIFDYSDRLTSLSVTAKF